MARKRKTKAKACRGTGDLLRYLKDTIIPDLKATPKTSPRSLPR